MTRNWPAAVLAANAGTLNVAPSKVPRTAVSTAVGTPVGDQFAAVFQSVPE